VFFGGEERSGVGTHRKNSLFLLKGRKKRCGRGTAGEKEEKARVLSGLEQQEKAVHKKGGFSRPPRKGATLPRNWGEERIRTEGGEFWVGKNQGRGKGRYYGQADSTADW